MRTLIVAVVLAIAAGCITVERRVDPSANGQRNRDGRGGSGRLASRPTGEATAGEATPGIHPMGLREDRDALVLVPPGYTAQRRWPLAVVLGGAGADAETGIGILRAQAEREGIALVAPPPAGRTWDLLRGGFGSDLEFVDASLGAVFTRYAIDPDRVAIVGFSDGASYALSVGLTNGDLFGHVIAFSPGFAQPTERRGEPAIFISHGREDDVLPIQRTSRRIVERLREQGYDVEYVEFDGGHTIPPEVADRAALWLTGG